MRSKEPILIVYGPTGVGKTLFSLAVAEKIPAEIINMDVGQLYTPLSIGTAKPDLRTVSVPHHAFDVLDEPRHFTVVAYRTLCAQLIDEIRARGNMPILVGGSGFYLKSLLFPQHELASDAAEDGSWFEGRLRDAPHHERNSVLQAPPAHGENEQWEKLHQIDPERASRIHPHDVYRVQRALAIWERTQQKPSHYKPIFNPLPALQSATILFLTRDRQELYERIDERVGSMLQEGWLNEVKSLMGTPWKQFIKQKKLIGYNELVDVLQSNPDNGDTEGLIANSVLSIIQQRTRNYAKRQGTFWRMLAALYEQVPMDKRSGFGVSFTSVNLTTACIEEQSKCIVKKLTQMRDEI